MSIGDLLRENWIGRRFYKIVPTKLERKSSGNQNGGYRAGGGQQDDDDKSENTARTMNDSNILI